MKRMDPGQEAYRDNNAFSTYEVDRSVTGPDSTSEVLQSSSQSETAPTVVRRRRLCPPSAVHLPSPAAFAKATAGQGGYGRPPTAHRFEIDKGPKALYPNLNFLPLFLASIDPIQNCHHLH